MGELVNQKCGARNTKQKWQMTKPQSKRKNGKQYGVNLRVVPGVPNSLEGGARGVHSFNQLCTEVVKDRKNIAAHMEKYSLDCVSNTNTNRKRSKKDSS